MSSVNLSHVINRHIIKTKQTVRPNLEKKPKVKKKIKSKNGVSDTFTQKETLNAPYQAKEGGTSQQQFDRNLQSEQINLKKINKILEISTENESNAKPL